MATGAHVLLGSSFPPSTAKGHVDLLTAKSHFDQLVANLFFVFLVGGPAGIYA